MSTLTVGTIAEKVTDAGVAVDGVTLKDGGATFTSAVGVTGNTTITSGNLVIGTSGNGIDFSSVSGSASGSSSALLDDYEEGTFTLAVSSGFTLDATFSQSYRKIGDIVHVFISFQADVTNGTECVLTGLPFNCAVGNEPVLVLFNDGTTNDHIPRGRTNASQPQFKFNPKNTASNIQIIIQGTYRVSS
tara:strand:+ start:20 stop:586 length:567 start_codon:yes stop_codon:yes gene_type:complete